MAHSSHAPSSAGRLAECAGYPALLAAGDTIETDPEAAELGDLAHFHGSQILKQMFAREPVEMPGDPELSYHLRGYAVHLSAVTAGIMPDLAVAGVEARGHAKKIHALAWGTADFSGYVPARKSIVIRDLKYGWGIVNPVRNKQLIVYAQAELEKWEPYVLPGDIEYIDVGVYQPRPNHRDGPARNWVVPIAEWPQHVEEVRQAYIRSTAPNAPLTAGAHCANCNVAHRCGVLEEYTGTVYEHTGMQYPATLSNKSLGREIKVLEGMEAALKAKRLRMQILALTRINEGQVVPGLSIVKTPGHRKWKAEVDVKKTGEQLGVELVKETPISPHQASLAGVPDELLTAFTYRPSGAAKLITIDASEDAKEAFKNG